MWRAGDRIQPETLSAFADDLVAFVHLKSSDRLCRLPIAPSVQFVLRMRVTRFEERTKDGLVTFLYKYRSSHRRCGAQAPDMIVMVM